MGSLKNFTDGGIDPSQHEPGRDYTPLPPGWYPVEVESAEVKPTKAGTGQMLKVMLSVLGENYANRKVFLSLNIMNPSTQAQEIGRRELADLARACGIPFLDDEDKLLGKQLMVRVVIKQDEGFEPDNQVKGYKALDGSKPAAPAPQQQKAAAPAASKPQHTPVAPAGTAAPSKGKLPWER